MRAQSYFGQPISYFINNRGDEAMGTVWSYLDITALGRQESPLNIEAWPTLGVPLYPWKGRHFPANDTTLKLGSAPLEPRVIRGPRACFRDVAGWARGCVMEHTDILV